jgi:hypothetical protein
MWLNDVKLELAKPYRRIGECRHSCTQDGGEWSASHPASFPIEQEGWKLWKKNSVQGSIRDFSLEGVTLGLSLINV